MENGLRRNGLFSIDVDAHLKKAAAYTFGSPSHFPVELIRAALRRNAAEVRVRTHHRFIQVCDDGEGFTLFWKDILRQLLDPAVTPELKEAAVERIQEPDGYGILAIFAASPDKITVETTAADHSSWTLAARRDHVAVTNPSSLKQGSAITLYTSGRRDVSRENYILDLSCRGVQRPIYLNDRLISGKSLLSGQIAILDHPGGGSSHFKKGCVGIPLESEICRIRLLDCGIPYKHLTMPPQRGFIFDAAIEYNGELTAGPVKELTEFARRLYEWLCARFIQFPASYRERIQELVFIHSRLTLDDSFLQLFSPFKVFGRNTWLSLPNVMEIAAREGVRAVPIPEDRPGRGSAGRVTLALTREQADFLVNRHDIPITFLPSSARRSFRIPEFCFRLYSALRRRFRRFLAFGLDRFIIPPDQLTPEEQFFLEQAEVWRCEGDHGPQEICLISAPGPFAALPSRRKGRLLIRRKRRLTREAIRRVARDPRMIELFKPLFVSANMEKN